MAEVVISIGRITVCQCERPVYQNERFTYWSSVEGGIDGAKQKDVRKKNFIEFIQADPACFFP
jgi:hypothetical protein